MAIEQRGYGGGDPSHFLQLTRKEKGLVDPSHLLLLNRRGRKKSDPSHLLLLSMQRELGRGLSPPPPTCSVAIS